MKFLVCVAIFVVFDHGIDAKVYDRCGLARELKSRGVPVGDLADWVCIARYESSYNTKAMNRDNTDGSYDWGLFQINDRFWCDPEDGRHTENECRIKCRQLLSDNIGPAVECALQIKRSQSFTAWVAYNNRCSNGRAESVKDCGV